MSSQRAWMVRAGRGGRFFEDFRDRSRVAIGWAKVGDLTTVASRDAVSAIVRAAYPHYRDQAVTMAAGQLFRFVKEFSQGDRVVTYDPSARRYLRGYIVGPYSFQPAEENEEYRNQRSVRWELEISRDSLTNSARNSLGAISTIFRIPQDVAAELWGETSTKPQASPKVDDDPVLQLSVAADLTEDEISEQAAEAIKDRISQLSWQEMQELVAGLLRSMGYKTTVSPTGPDRGKDIVASPDGLGFQDPRVVVEVKHRLSDRMGAQDIRGFLGGRRPGDKGLYVSTGGFSRDAYYEAERASIPMTLMDFDMLVKEILDRYPHFDEETKQILPLKRLYWPIRK